jgi:hypothetical protein
MDVNNADSYSIFKPKDKQIPQPLPKKQMAGLVDRQLKSR